MNEYRLMPIDGTSHEQGSGCAAETFMEAYGVMMSMEDENGLFQEFMDVWQGHATQTYMMLPANVAEDSPRASEYLKHENRKDIKIVLVFPDLSVAVCGDDGGVATDVPSMMSDW